MPALVRNNGPRGVRFYDADGETQFIHVLDASSRIGPRPATEDDMIAHPKEWSVYEAGIAADEERARQAKAALDARLALAPQAAELDLREADLVGRPLVTFSDPPGGRPDPEPMPHAERRAKAAR